MLSLWAPDQTLVRLSRVLPAHLPALGRLSKMAAILDARAWLLLVLELLTMLVKTQDINQREGAQPTIPTTMEQAASFLRALLSLFETDNDGSDSSIIDVLPSGMTNSRVDVKDRTDAPFNVDHLSQATATSPVRNHSRVGGIIRTPPSKHFVTLQQYSTMPLIDNTWQLKAPENLAKYSGVGA